MFTRQNWIRPAGLVLLLALLLLGLCLDAGNLPALLVETFVFLLLLTFSNASIKDAVTAALAETVREAAAFRFKK